MSVRRRVIVRTTALLGLGVSGLALVGLAVVGLAGCESPGAADRARDTTADQPREIENLVDLTHEVTRTGLNGALDLYYGDHAAYPQRLTQLVVRPADPGAQEVWQGPYARSSALADPWGKSWYYRAPGLNNSRTYDLGSNGPDRVWGTQDDITNW